MPVPTKIVADYCVCSTFYMPEWMTKDQIDFYYIKYDMLHVTMKDGTKFTIHPTYSATDADFKRPDNDYEDEAEEEEMDEEEYEELNLEDLIEEVKEEE